MRTRERALRATAAAVLLCGVSLLPRNGFAAACRFENAVYAQTESSYRLRFVPSRELARFPGSTNVFFVESKDFERPLDGWVIWNNGESRPNGSVMRDCPPDGMSNEDFADCTKWEGVIYALEGGDAHLLPGEQEPPPATILLPDFGRQMRYSVVLDLGKEEVPWDVFRFQGCAP